MNDVTRRDQQAARLRHARQMRNFRTAKEAAERFGFNYNTYVQHERGHAGITRAAKDYARAFRVSEAWLLTGEGPAEDPLSGHDELRELFERLVEAPEETVQMAISVLRAMLDRHGSSGKTQTTRES
jgi:hypothetical protein